MRLPKSSRQWAVAVAILLIIIIFVTHGYEIPQAGPIDDDSRGIIGHQGTHVRDEWTKGTYKAAGKGNPIPWGPAATTIQFVLAGIVGRENIAPFRALNLGIFAVTLWLITTKTVREPHQKALALSGCAFLATSPVSAQPLSWASCTFDVLGAFVAVLCLYATMTQKKWVITSVAALALGGSLLAGQIWPVFVVAAWIFLARNSKEFSNDLLVGLCAPIALGFCKPTLSVLFPIVLAGMIARNGLSKKLVYVGIMGCIGVVLHQGMYTTVIDPSKIAMMKGAVRENPISNTLANLGLQLVAPIEISDPDRLRPTEHLSEGLLLRALMGIGGFLAVLFATTRLQFRTETRVLILISWGLWVGGNVPGVLYSVHHGYASTRYCFAPMVAVVATIILASKNVSERNAQRMTWTVLILSGLQVGEAMERIRVWRDAASEAQERKRLSIPTEITSAR